MEVNNISDKWLVYAHIVPKEITNYDHDKYYIGITSQSPEERFKNGLGYEYCTLFWKAIKKYRWENIEHIIFKTNLNKRNACELEKLVIAYFNSNNPLYGYNLTIGGEGVAGYHRTIEQRKQISERQKGRIPPNKGKNASELTKSRQRDAWVKRRQRGGDLGTKKPIIVHPLERRYDSLVEACKDLGLNYRSAVNVIRGHRNSIYGYTFSYVGGYINQINKEEIKNDSEI